MKALLHTGVAITIAMITTPTIGSIELPEPILEVEQRAETNDALLPAHLMPVCGCESLGDPTAEPKQFNKDGMTVQGPGNNWGMCQINGTAHDERARALGLDYKGSAEDNATMAKILYAESGYKPWYQWSGHCWEDDPRVDQAKLEEAKNALIHSPTPL